jgi:hypothetical protein
MLLCMPNKNAMLYSHYTFILTSFDVVSPFNSQQKLFQKETKRPRNNGTKKVRPSSLAIYILE